MVATDIAPQEAFGETNPRRALERYARELAAGDVTSLEPIMSALLTLENKPYTLRGHSPFSPLFSIYPAELLVLMTGRQLSKSTGYAARIALTSSLFPNLKSLYIAPLSSQVKLFAQQRLLPFYRSPGLRQLINQYRDKPRFSISQILLPNGASNTLVFAGKSAERIRGASADVTNYDEAQDFDEAHEPIVDQCSAMSTRRSKIVAGTAKTEDTFLNRKFQQSSQAEWVIPCDHCTTNGHRTMNIPTREFHAAKMIGPPREDISIHRPGVICHKCRKPLPVYKGFWEHRYPERAVKRPGYHVSQMLIPHHYGNPNNWAAIYYALNGGLPEFRFWNEIGGEPWDLSQKMISEADLKRASNLGWRNFADETPPEWLTKYNRSRWRKRCLAIDWGGGGASDVSFTVMAIVGLTHDGRLEVIYAKRLYSVDPVEELQLIKKLLTTFRCDFVAHDFGGGGHGLRQQYQMQQLGIRDENIRPIMYVTKSVAAVEDCVNLIPPSERMSREYMTADKSFTLAYLCDLIRYGHVSFFDYDGDVDVHNQGLIPDFLALIRDRRSSVSGGEYFRVATSSGRSDDFAMAVNFAMIALYAEVQAWPNIVRLIDPMEGLQLTPAQLDEINGTGDFELPYSAELEEAIRQRGSLPPSEYDNDMFFG